MSTLSRLLGGVSAQHADRTGVRPPNKASAMKSINRNLLTAIIGFPATLLHGDPFVLDRWIWLRRRLPRTANHECLLDVGCGSGGFTIGAALRGYESVGVSWDERNQRAADERAKIVGAERARFEVLDVRVLEKRTSYSGAFDVVLCLECIEHILDDRKLMADMAACLKPGGRLLLTTPYLYCPPITRQCYGPFAKTEDGTHVRRGYTRAMLEELCVESGLVPEEISYCSGLVAQWVTRLHRRLIAMNSLVGWCLTLPLRILPPLADPVIGRIWPSRQTSICLEAVKPRF